MDPLERREILSKEERQCLFSNLRQLLEFHLTLLEEMRKTDKPWEAIMKMVRVISESAQQREQLGQGR